MKGHYFSSDDVMPKRRRNRGHQSGFKKLQESGKTIHKNMIPRRRGYGMRVVSLEKLPKGYQVVRPSGSSHVARHFRTKRAALTVYNRLLDIGKSH